MTLTICAALTPNEPPHPKHHGLGDHRCAYIAGHKPLKKHSCPCGHTWTEI